MNLAGWDYSTILDSHISWRQDDFTCDLCSKTFRSSGMLARHYAVHADNSSIACDVCAHPFDRKDVLLNHKRRMHPGSDHTHLEDEDEEGKRAVESLHSCQHCNRSFSSRLSLGRHTKMLHSMTLPLNSAA